MTGVGTVVLLLCVAASWCGVPTRDVGCHDDRWNDMYLRRMMIKLRSIGWNDNGASLVEYALLIALISLIAVVAVRFFGSELSTAYSDIAESIP